MRNSETGPTAKLMAEADLVLVQSNIKNINALIENLRQTLAKPNADSKEVSRIENLEVTLAGLQLKEGQLKLKINS
jgi:hypothetical protein